MRKEKNSVAFFVTGNLAFATGIAFWAISGRADAMIFFVSAAVQFAGAWLFERCSKPKPEIRPGADNDRKRKAL